jgi:L-iditol 2-dehydrogenase
LFGEMDLRVVDLPMPKCGPDEVLIRTEYCGVCGSDIPRVLEGKVRFFPVTLGHEFSATVVEVGSNVTHVKEGDLVAAIPLLVCHKCPNCLDGNYGQCLSARFIGSSLATTGGFAEYNVLPATNVMKLPEGIDPMAAAFVEPASVAMHGLFLMDFKPCTDIAIMGVGTIGNLVLQAAKIMGARHIYAFDSDDERLALAEKSGAYRCYNTSDPSFLDAFLADTGGLGVENVVEAVGKEVTINNCIKIAKVNGRISLIGTMNEDVTIPPELFYQGFSRKQLSMHGVWMSYSVIFPGKPWRSAAHFIRTGQIDVSSILDRVIPLEEAMMAFEDYRIPGKIKGKVMLKF